MHTVFMLVHAYYTRVRARITPGWQVDLATVRVRTLPGTNMDRSRNYYARNSVAPS